MAYGEKVRRSSRSCSGAAVMQIERLHRYGLSAAQLAGLIATQSPDKGTEHGAGDINPKGLKGS